MDPGSGATGFTHLFPLGRCCMPPPAPACPDPGAHSTGYVMGCHVLSCAGSAWRGRTGPAAVVPVRRSGYSVRFLRLAVSGIGLSSRSVFASFSRRPAARRGGPTMPRAIARGRAGALAPARFARLIAPAREPERRAHLSCPPHRWFSAPAPVREGAASGNRSRSVVLFSFYHTLPNYKPSTDIFS